MALRGGRGYPELLQRLAAAARRDLGEDAEVEIDPPGLGGVRARAGSRRVDYTLASLADRRVEDLGPLLARRWGGGGRATEAGGRSRGSAAPSSSSMGWAMPTSATWSSSGTSASSAR